MPQPAASTAYDAVAKTLHWIIAIIVILMLIGGLGLEDLPDAEKSANAGTHATLGTIVLLLMIARLIWRLNHPAPALPDGMPRWQVIASKASHHGLYLLVLLQPVWGIGQSIFASYDVVIFGALNYGSLAAADETVHQIFHVAHGLTGTLIMAIVVIHIGAAFYHHFIQKDNVLRRMLPFVKPS